MPVVGILVERRGHVDGVDLDRQRQRGLHLEVAGVPHQAAEPGVRRVAADLVGIGLRAPRVDPPQQRLEADLVVRVGEKVDEQRHASERLVRVAEDRVAVAPPSRLSATTEYRTCGGSM